jgi:dTDP-4-amino-4,6-dideoxygalactose transaminase
MTFCATANAILHTGATPVFVDVNRQTLTIDPARIEQAITERTRALMPVHFAGRPCDMDALCAICRKHKLLLIEDAAHAIEAAYRGKKIGTIGDMTCFSFYVTKNIYTGEGGMVTCDDEDTAARIKMYGLHGMTQDAWARYSDEGYRHYQVVVPGYKYNMIDLQAAIGCAQLPHIDEYYGRRTAIWEAYNSAFAKLPLTLPAAAEADTVHARHLYTVLLNLDALRCSRDEFMHALDSENIGTGVHYISLHLHPLYRDRFGFTDESFPLAAEVSRRTLSLPLSPKLTDDDVDDVIRAVARVVDYFAK